MRNLGVTIPAEFERLTEITKKEGLKNIRCFLIPVSKYRKMFDYICNTNGKDPYEERVKGIKITYRGIELKEYPTLNIRPILL